MNYDEKNDVLYLIFSDSSTDWYGDDEDNENIVLHRDSETDEIVGMTIFYARSEKPQRTAELEALGYSPELLLA